MMRFPLLGDSHLVERAEPLELSAQHCEAEWERQHYLYTLGLTAIDELRGTETWIPHHGHSSLTASQP